MDYFTAIRLYSAFELCLFTGLCVSAIAGHDTASLVLGWSHGVGWILLCLLVLRGCLKRVFPWPLFAATVSPAGPVGSTLGLEYLARRRRRSGQPGVDDLLHGPAVAVGVGEEHEPAPREVRDLRDLDAPAGQVLARGLDVVDHHLQPLQRPGLHLGEPAAHRDRRLRARGSELHEADLVADRVVVVGVEAGLHVELLGAVHVRVTGIEINSSRMSIATTSGVDSLSVS